MIRFVFRWLFRGLILVIVLIVALLLLKDLIFREIAQNRIRAATGLETHIGKLEVGLVDPQITVRNLLLYNPPEFGGAPFLDMPEIHLEYDRSARSLGKIRLTLLRLNLAELTIVQNKAGESNLEFLQKNVHTPPKEGTQAAKAVFDGIDTLNLTLGQVKRYNVQTPDKVEVTRLDVKNEIYTNLRTEDDLKAAVITVALRKGLREFSKGLPGGLGAILGGGSGSKSTTPAPSTTKEAGK
jgi:hypothetical protein